MKAKKQLLLGINCILTRNKLLLKGSVKNQTSRKKRQFGAAPLTRGSSGQGFSGTRTMSNKWISTDVKDNYVPSNGSRMEVVADVHVSSD